VYTKVHKKTLLLRVAFFVIFGQIKKLRNPCLIPKQKGCRESPLEQPLSETEIKNMQTLTTKKTLLYIFNFFGLCPSYAYL
jgi:hypothetical protein